MRTAFASALSSGEDTDAVSRRQTRIALLSPTALLSPFIAARCPPQLVLTPFVASLCAQGKARLDALHLQLQNYLYEKLHLLHEIQKCQSFECVNLNPLVLSRPRFCQPPPTTPRSLFCAQGEERPHGTRVNGGAPREEAREQGTAVLAGYGLCRSSACRRTKCHTSAWCFGRAGPHLPIPVTHSPSTHTHTRTRTRRTSTSTNRRLRAWTWRWRSANGTHLQLFAAAAPAPVPCSLYSRPSFSRLSPSVATHGAQVSLLKGGKEGEVYVGVSVRG